MRLHGRITRSDRPVDGAYVQLIGPSGDYTAEVRTDESGRFLFYPAAGSWELRVSLPGGSHLKKSVTITSGEAIDVQISAENGVEKGEQIEICSEVRSS
ncbi:MAG: DUF1416 domain-containing protein [Candidatus Dormibacteraeota bacterium]|nr:DUF1416 domain-containing protein [Candidatus Dormibacteraeota bacterium]